MPAPIMKKNGLSWEPHVIRICLIASGRVISLMLAIQLTPNPSKHSSPNNGGTALAAFLNGDAVSVFAYYFRPCQLRQILQSDIDSPLAS